MRLFKRRIKHEDEIKKGLKLRLERSSTNEVLRWVDNIHTGLGKNISEMRKSLTHNDTDQALVYIEDIRLGAVSLLAASEVLLEREESTGYPKGN